jgi:catechol 2,3-dioxygenase-like lactoylglutathione lyase family enzyme/DNA-binding CsgD family transcriptional regulator
MKRGRGRPPHPDLLTPKEWQVLDSVRHGMSRAEIAHRRGSSVAAVDYHLENIRGKLGVRRTRDLARWDGYPVGSALSARRRPAMTSPVQLGELGQVSLWITSVERAEHFYRDQLGLPHLYTFGDLTFLDCAGTRLYLHRVDADAWKPGSTLYFRVPDIQAAYESMTAAGVAFRQVPHLIHRHESGVEEYMAFFEDPDGNLLALMSQVMPSGE